MSEIKAGGGHHICVRCGATVYGSKLHTCDKTQLILVLTAERDRLRADLYKVESERDELIEMIEGLLICIAGKSHAMQNVINRIQGGK